MKRSIAVIMLIVSSMTAPADSYLTENAKKKLAHDRALRSNKDVRLTKEEKAQIQRYSESIKSSQIGTFGYFQSSVKIDQIISRNQALITFGWWDSGLHEYNALLDNVSTHGWVDGERLVFNQKFIISGTASYTTVLGAKRTVLRITIYHPPEATNEVSYLRPRE